MGNAQSAAARAAERQLATGTDQKQPVCTSDEGVYTRARLRRPLYRGYKYSLADGMFWKYRGRYPFLSAVTQGRLPWCDDVAHTCSHTNSVHEPGCKAYVRDFTRKCRADAGYHPQCAGQSKNTKNTTTSLAKTTTSLANRGTHKAPAGRTARGQDGRRIWESR